jgi:hypothetical protein
MMSPDPRQLLRAESYMVAVCQKATIFCILVAFFTFGAEYASYLSQNEEKYRLFLFINVGIGLVAVVFSFLLALKVFVSVFGIVLGLVPLVPCVGPRILVFSSPGVRYAGGALLTPLFNFLGLLILLVINSRATSLLTERGYSVGLLGARLSQFQDDSLPRDWDKDIE